MTDMNKERELFEEALGKHNIHNVHLCTVYDFKRNEYFPSDVCDPSEDRIVDSINLSWKMWQEKAKAQAVQQSFEIGRLQDRITELLDERQDLYAQINNDQAVPETHVVVPKIANKKMVNAGYEAHDGFYTNGQVQDVYQAIIKASESGAEG